MDGGQILTVQTGGRIGPNAILQTIAILDHCEGRLTRDLVLETAGVAVPSADSGMLPEGDCAAVHRAVRFCLPDRADGLLRLAGLATGDYILRHRIPAPARAVIRALPGFLGARLLVAAISRHSWTFAGTGSFRVAGWRPLTFEIVNNPLIRGEHAVAPMCHWHAAVFERLFSRLVWRSAVVIEVTCAATGAPSCRFTVSPRTR
jgi:divinyl protochlorophyllide a 8-vinyl-reductase